MDIYVRKAYKDYNKLRVLDIDYLDLKKGYIYSIMGLNGSGKTTLMECIAGINSLTCGTITYGDNRGIEDVRHDISIMMQKPYMFDDSVINNIARGLKFRRFKKEDIKVRVEKYLSYFDMKDLLYKNAKKLSGGEAAKTALLRTAVLETNIVLLDEPTASMDMESTIWAEKLIKDMAVLDRTIIIVTHDLYQAKRIADYIIFMDKGRVIEMGEKNKVLQNPENELVRQILNM